MRDPNDDNAQPVDRSIIDLIVHQSAPERVQDWNDLCDRIGVSFHPIRDRKGITFWAWGKRVEFDHKTMAWLWILGFAAWKVFRLYGPHILWQAATSQVIDDILRAKDTTFEEARAEYEAILYAVRDLPEMLEIDDSFDWPHGVPHIQPTRHGLDQEHTAAFDLITIANAYMLLHEVRHIVFSIEGDRPARRDEELACDAFAREFLLSRVDEYAASSNTPRSKVLEKRSLGIALGSYVISEWTPGPKWYDSSEYPSVVDRLDPMFGDILLGDDSMFWDFAGSLLAATVIRRDPRATIPRCSGRVLCQALVEALRRQT